jgi:hypothetical protein
MPLRHCDHSEMDFRNGKLTCRTCGEDRTPLQNHQVVVVFSDYREKIVKDIEKVIDGLPEEVLKDIELYAEYLKWRRKSR